MKPAWLALALIVSALAAAGCGSGPEQQGGENRGSQGGGAQISAQDDSVLQSSINGIDADCQGGPGGTPVGRDVDSLLQVYRRDGPGGVYETGQANAAENLRTLLGGLSAQLQRCGHGHQAARIRAVLRGS